MTHDLGQLLTLQLDGTLRIVEADRLLAALHRRAGGGEDDPIAVPALADIARDCLRLGSRVSRTVRMADGESDISAWVDAMPEVDGVLLHIPSWHEQGPAEREAPGSDLVGDQCGSLQLDSAMRILAHGPLEPIGIEDSLVGDRLFDRFEPDTADDRSRNIYEALAERQSISSFSLVERTSRRTYLISAEPLIDGSGLFAGWIGQLRPETQDVVLADDSSDDAEPVSTAESMLSASLFGSTLAPALRQPLDRIIANAETIHDTAEGPLRQSYVQYARDISMAARHMVELVEDMRDVEAIEREGFTAADDDIDLIDCARRAAGLLSVKAADHRIEIVLPDADETLPSTGEYRRVLQILVNLIGNAIRYAPDGSTIYVDAEQAQGQAVVTIEDEGKGIAPEMRPKVFEKFERLGRHGDGGSGLGLYISRRLATALNGELSIEDPVRADGARFRLSLPARQD